MPLPRPLPGSPAHGQEAASISPVGGEAVVGDGGPGKRCGSLPDPLALAGLRHGAIHCRA